MNKLQLQKRLLLLLVILMVWGPWERRIVVRKPLRSKVKLNDPKTTVADVQQGKPGQSEAVVDDVNGYLDFGR